MKIKIEEYSDGFSILLDDAVDPRRFNFDQEDPVQGLTEVFEALGFMVEYEEIF